MSFAPHSSARSGGGRGLRAVCAIAVLFLFLFAAVNPTFADEVPGPARADRGTEARFSFVAVGDALIHRGVYEAARKSKTEFDFKPNVRLLRDRIRGFDVAFYNQETILGGVALGLSTYPCFNSPHEVGDAMLDAGFNLVSLANNHTLDRGEKGVLASLEYWKDKTDIVTAGSYSSQEDMDEPILFEVNGIKCAFLAYTTSTNGLRAPKGKEHYVAVYNADRVKEDVERARDAGAEAVIVSMHWGAEYVFTPGDQQKTIAKHLAGLGVNLVVGHHAHVVQPVQMVDETLVIYSLGNFISAQNEMYKLIGLMVSLDVVRRGEGDEATVGFENVIGTLLYNPRRSVLGRYVVVPFDLLTTEILKDFDKVHKKYAAYVKVDDTIEIRPPAKVPPKAPAKKK
ncbi:MAG: CapA family protein [Synergistota bacterium]|nr:CapA family protein [Synergistota bacterium]